MNALTSVFFNRGSADLPVVSECSAGPPVFSKEIKLRPTFVASR